MQLAHRFRFTRAPTNSGNRKKRHTTNSPEQHTQKPEPNSLLAKRTAEDCRTYTKLQHIKATPTTTSEPTHLYSQDHPSRDPENEQRHTSVFFILLYFPPTILYSSPHHIPFPQNPATPLFFASCAIRSKKRCSPVVGIILIFLVFVQFFLNADIPFRTTSSVDNPPPLPPFPSATHTPQGGAQHKTVCLLERISWSESGGYVSGIFLYFLLLR